MKKCIIFDLDGTLAPSKGMIDQEMASLLNSLLKKTAVAVVSGGTFKQFEKQLIGNLNCPPEYLANLFLFPTSGSACLKYTGDWKMVYQESLASQDKKRIIDAIEVSVKKLFPDLPKDKYGPQIEDRGSQITFSALGQEAPLSEKEKWDPDGSKKIMLRDEIGKMLPDMGVRTGGLTSIDITKSGLDKEYGINKVREELGVLFEDMVFIGDALQEGGNDFPVIKTGIQTISVRNPEDTKKVIEKILKEN